MDNTRLMIYRDSPLSKAAHLTLTALALVISFGHASSTYLADKKYGGHHKTNSIKDNSYNNHYGPIFKTDKDIHRYLRIFGADAMLWTCKNAIQPYWNGKPLPVVELYCEGVGSMKDVHWYHNGRKLNINNGKRYKMAMYPHFYEGHYFSNWIDFRLRIYNATHKDSGVYSFEVIGKKGSINAKNIYVDISEKRRRRKTRLWRDKSRRHKNSKDQN